ncbi:Uncharacterised protein [BD1-7 clade bacterium]|uniref:Uncharacterized protein n=1 Tax=BD1-7 clade bacterium TaxID=2029982 RepID=A0A5S9PHL6_9GAMM|nr:Uncharacterised protein [BD1-7 clade bacterium]
MDDFFKTKVGFTIGLLAAVFTLKPLIDANSSHGFSVFGLKITIQYAYLFLMACLGLAVYFISLQFASQKHMAALDKASNACYAVALATPPIFAVFWILVLLGDLIGGMVKSIPPSFLNVMAGALTGVLASFLSSFLTKSIQSKFSKVEKEKERQVDLSLMTRASELYKSGMYDLSVLEASKVIESTLRGLLELRGVSVTDIGMGRLIDLADKNRLLTEVDVSLLHEIRKARNVSVHSVDAITQSIAKRIINLSRELIFKFDIGDEPSAYEWLEKNRQTVLKQFKSGDRKKCKKPIEMLRQAWIHRDGAVWLEIAEFFEVLLENSPELLIEMFASDAETFEEWLMQGGNQLFTDFVGGDVDRLIRNKASFEKSLSNYLASSNNELYRSIANEILEMVRSTQVREID